jgi:hypothetical protein
MSDIETIDDRNPVIKYSGTWSLTGSSSEYLNTNSYATSLGASASVNFSGMYAIPPPLSSLLVSLILPIHTNYFAYIGTSISVYGTITQIFTGAPPISNYTIDSGVPYQFAAQQQKEIQYDQLFFRATGLSFGLPHTLVITNVADNDVLTDPPLPHTDFPEREINRT